MKKIVLATHNKGKVKELQALLIAQNYAIIPQSDYQVTEAAETGSTFVENALIKARHATTMTGLPAIADDSGLSVQALGGAPGIYSARYAGLNANDTHNNEKLLANLTNIPTEKRQAYFYCALVYLRHQHDPTPIICEGKWHGIILTHPQGNNGFGYDPLFYIPEINCTAADLSREEKSKISHRGQALRSLLKALQHHG